MEPYKELVDKLVADLKSMDSAEIDPADAEYPPKLDAMPQEIGYAEHMNDDQSPKAKSDPKLFRVQNEAGETGTCRSYYDHFEIDWDSGRTESTLDLSDIGVSTVVEPTDVIERIGETFAKSSEPIDYAHRLEDLQERRDPDGIEDPAVMDAAVQAVIDRTQAEQQTELETRDANMWGAAELPATEPEAISTEDSQASQPSLPISSVPIMEATEAARQTDSWQSAMELQEIATGRLTVAQGAIESGDPVVVWIGEQFIVVSGVQQAAEQAAQGASVLVQLIDLNSAGNYGLVDWKVLGL